MKSFGIALSLLLFVSCSWAVDNIAVQWTQLNYQFLLVPLSGRNSSTADPTPNGLATGGARSIFLLHSCMYDAWAAYQANASYSHLGNGIPKTTGDAATVATSVAYAGYTAITYIWGSSSTYITQARNVMTSNGYNPDDFNNNTNNAAGVGNRACYNILIQRQRDGYNEKGDETMSFSYGTPWSDYTNYKSANIPQAQPIDCSQLRSQTAWVPLVLPTGTQSFSSIHMMNVKPFALSSPFEFSLNGPNLPGTNTEAAFLQEVNNVTNYSATLNDARKMSSEYWARSSGAALWEGITVQSARNANLTLSDTIKLFFAAGIGAYDAGISCWSYKRVFDSLRPNSAVACFKSGNITAWKGPYMGAGVIRSVDFQSYLVMPNFAEYPSGHSTWSGAASVVLRNFFGSDTFRGDSVFIQEGTSVVEPKITSGNPGYIAGVTDVPNSGPGSPGYSPATNVTLSWATFSEAQDDAGISRLYGGFHFTTGDEDAKALGRYIGQKAWNVAKSFWEGNPPTPINPNNTQPNTYTTVPQGTPDNAAIQFAQVNFNALLKPLGSGGSIDDSPNGIATAGARSLFILGSCFFDAWAVYKANVTSSHPNSIGKKTNLDTPANIAKSIAFAGYTALIRFWRSYPSELAAITNLLTSLGYSTSEANSTDANTPQGIGYLACKNVIDLRQNDGYNELGTSPYTQNPTAAWKDYSNFKPQNDAQFQSTANCNTLNNVYGWMPLQITNTTSQPFSSIQMIRVKPFAVSSPFEFRMNGPNMPNTPRAAAFQNEINNLISYSANLNDTLKMIAEYWASSSGAALWGGITIQSARNARLSLEDTIKLFFAEGVGSYDAGITCWSYKRLYQNMRPNMAIQCFGPNNNFTGWLGPYNGVGSISRQQFQPYMTTPPFAEYPSGHSTWSGAAAVVLNNFFGGDTFRGDSVTFAAGTSVAEPKITAGNPGYIAGVTDVPNNGPLSRGYAPAQNLTLSWSTWTEAQDQAGISRVYGGWHPIAGNIDATAIGRLVGQRAWQVAQSYWINQRPSPSTTGGSTGTNTGIPTGTNTGAATTSSEVSQGVAHVISFVLLVVVFVLSL